MKFLEEGYLANNASKQNDIDLILIRITQAGQFQGYFIVAHTKQNRAFKKDKTFGDFKCLSFYLTYELSYYCSRICHP